MPPNTEFKLPIVVLISGTGSNLQAIIDAIARAALPVEIRAVISNRPAAEGLERARRAGIATQTLEHSTFADRAQFDAALMALIDAHAPALVVLAGFMRILTREFVEHYAGRLLNIHPSLLPDLPGMDTHRRAIAAGLTEHGASVHFVTPEVDGGPVIVQARVPVRRDDNTATLAARVLAQEHRLYPLVLRWYAEGRLRLVEGRIHLDDQVLRQPIIYDNAVPDAASC
jgi:phosphoribosylglycinamide formyltransferase-1